MSWGDPFSRPFGGALGSPSPQPSTGGGGGAVGGVLVIMLFLYILFGAALLSYVFTLLGAVFLWRGELVGWLFKVLGLSLLAGIFFGFWVFDPTNSIPQVFFYLTLSSTFCGIGFYLNARFRKSSRFNRYLEKSG
jgi:hypothetical protein